MAVFTESLQAQGREIPTQKRQGNILTDIGNALIDPVVRLGVVGASGLAKAQGNNVKANRIERDFFGNTDANLGLEALRGAAGVGAYLVPVGKASTALGALGRGVLAGGLGSLSQQDLSSGDISVRELAIGAGLGGAIGGGFKYMQNAPIRKAQTIIDDVDEQIALQADDLLRAGKSSKQINTALGLQGGSGNARLNYILQNADTNTVEGATKLKSQLEALKLIGTADEAVTGNATRIQQISDDITQNNKLPGLSTRLGDDVATKSQNMFTNTLDDKAISQLDRSLGQVNKKIISLVDDTPQDLNRIGRTITENAEEAELGQVMRELGKPRPSKGGGSIYKNAMNVTLDDGTPLLQLGDDADIAIQKGRRLLQSKGGILGQQIDDLSAQGATVSKQKVLNNLQKEIKASRVKSVKKVLRDVYNELDTALGQGDKVPLNELYRVKQEVGSELADWSTSQPNSLQTQGKTYARAYGQMNDVLDDALKSKGFEQMRELNKQVSTAEKLVNELRYKQNSLMGGKALSWADAAVGGLGYAATGGNPVGLIAGSAASKAMRSNAAQRFLINNQKRLGTAIGQIGMGQPGKMGQVVQNIPRIPVQLGSTVYKAPAVIPITTQ